jgi:hypothetical protein
MNFNHLEIMDKLIQFVSLWVFENKDSSWRLPCY